MFFEIFKKLCDERGITPTKASAEIGFSKGSVSYWRKNYNAGIDAKPDLHTAQKIADFFGVTVDSLLERQAPTPQVVQVTPVRQTGGFRDGGILPFSDDPCLTFEEKMIIELYRSNPDIHEAINRALGVVKLDDKK